MLPLYLRSYCYDDVPFVVHQCCNRPVAKHDDDNDDDDEEVIDYHNMMAITIVFNNIKRPEKTFSHQKDISRTFTYMHCLQHLQSVNSARSIHTFSGEKERKIMHHAKFHYDKDWRSF